MKMLKVVFPVEHCDLKTDEEVLNKIAENPKGWVLKRHTSFCRGVKEISASLNNGMNPLSSLTIPYSVTKSLIKRKLLTKANKNYFYFNIDKTK